MKPIGKYILISPIKEELETSSGLLLSAEDASQFRYKRATVASSGTEVSAIKAGDTIYYDSRAGYTMLIKNEQYSVIRETDVVVVE